MSPEELTLEDWRRFVEDNEWTFAKTMAANPHWYVIERNAVDHELFLRVYNEIETRGYQRRWGGKLWRTISFQGYDYWLAWGHDAGPNRGRGGIINRKPSESAGWEDAA